MLNDEIENKSILQRDLKRRPGQVVLTFKDKRNKKKSILKDEIEK
jgi:hypothetical protein